MAKSAIKKYWWIFIPPIFHVLASFSFTFTYWPEMLDWPRAMAQGWLPYRDFTMIYTPLIPLLIMLSGKIFGFTPLNLHLLGTFLLALTNALLVFAAYRLTRNKIISLLLGGLYLYLTLAFEGNTLAPANLLTPLFFGICLLQLSYLKNNKTVLLFLSGILMGLAFLTKQTTAYVLPEFPLLLSYLYFKRRRVRLIAPAFKAFVFPLLLIITFFLLILISLNILGDFYNWGVKFSLLLPTLTQKAKVSDILFPSSRHIPLLLGFCFLALSVVILRKNFISFFLFSWIILISLFIFPRFAYAHLLPAIAVFLLLIAEIYPLSKKKPLALAAAFIIIFLMAWPIFKKTRLESRTYLEPDIILMADYLSKTYPSSSLYIINSPEQIYFLTDKLPAVKPWVEQLPWQMAYFNQEFTLAFKTTPPDIVLYTPYKTNEFSPSLVPYLKENYSLVHSFPGGEQVLEKL